MRTRLVVAIVVWGSVAWIASSTSGAIHGIQDGAPSVQQSAVTAPAPVQSVSTAAADPRAVLDRYCVTCHNQRLKTAGFAIDQLDVNNPAADAEAWEKVVRKLRVGMMPPVGMPRPDAATYASVIAHLQSAIDRAPINPGRPRGLHRLNRAEYANAIRDVLALDLDVTTLLPPDDSGYGFDNIADVLGVSPALQERYLSAATKISAMAIGDVAAYAVPEEETFRVRADATQLQHVDGLPFGTRGGGLFHKVFPVDGTYQFSVKLYRTNTFAMRGLEFPHAVIVLVDGVQVLEEVIGGERDSHDDNPTTRGEAVEARLVVRAPVKAGRRSIAVTFIEKTQAESPFTLQPFDALLDNVEGAGVPKIDAVKINGPFDIVGPGDTPSRRRIFTCRPTGAADERACARAILGQLVRRAYRRPITDTDVRLLMEFFDEGRRDGGNFDQAIGLALRYVLASPEFTFRVEPEPVDIAEGRSYRLSDIEIASRLSFFLWSSVPDDELLRIAERGELRDRQVLGRQVRRMLADPKARALTQNFAGQWLYLRNLANHSPNYDDFPDFDDNLRVALRTETEMLFASIVGEDRSVLDLLNADYTFVNERLAKHYDIPNVYGSHFRRVPVTDEARRGILGHGSILTVTSERNRTSPVKRGKWVLEQLLGTAPPAPPPNVPVLMPAAEQGQKPKTMREEMEAHRTNPTCASCHQLMDPIGFAMETFDGIGGKREVYPGTSSAPGPAINTSGRLADGTAIDGVSGLRRALLSRPENVAQAFTEKLLVYALGRGTEYYDMPSVRKIVRDAAGANYRFSSLVMGIVTSPAFQMRVKAPAAAPDAVTAAR